MTQDIEWYKEYLEGMKQEAVNCRKYSLSWLEIANALESKVERLEEHITQAEKDGICIFDAT